MEKLLLNADEASYVLGISKSTLLRLTKAKKISRLQLSDGRVAWEKSEILKFIKDCGIDIIKKLVALVDVALSAFQSASVFIQQVPIAFN